MTNAAFGQGYGGQVPGESQLADAERNLQQMQDQQTANKLQADCLAALNRYIRARDLNQNATVGFSDTFAGRMGSFLAKVDDAAASSQEVLNGLPILGRNNSDGLTEQFIDLSLITPRKQRVAAALDGADAAAQAIINAAYDEVAPVCPEMADEGAELERKKDLSKILEMAGTGASAKALQLVKDAAAVMADPLASQGARSDAQLSLHELLGDGMRYRLQAFGVDRTALQKAYVAARMAAYPTSDSYVEQASNDFALSREFPLPFFRLLGSDFSVEKVAPLASAYADACFSAAAQLVTLPTIQQALARS